jgi:hypothetical protein
VAVIATLGDGDTSRRRTGRCRRTRSGSVGWNI